MARNAASASLFMSRSRSRWVKEDVFLDVTKNRKKQDTHSQLITMSLPQQDEINEILRRQEKRTWQNQDPRSRYVNAAPLADFSRLSKIFAEGKSLEAEIRTQPQPDKESDGSDPFPNPDDNDYMDEEMGEEIVVESGGSSGDDEEDVNEDDGEETLVVSTRKKAPAPKRTAPRRRGAGAGTFELLVRSTPQSNPNYGSAHGQGLPTTTVHTATVPNLFSGGRALSKAGLMHKQRSAERTRTVEKAQRIARETRGNRSDGVRTNSGARSGVEEGVNNNEQEGSGDDEEMNQNPEEGAGMKQLFPTFSGTGPYQTSFPGSPMHHSVLPIIDFLEDTREWNKDREEGEAVVDEMILMQLIENKCAENLPGGGNREGISVEVDLMNMLLEEGCSLQMFKKIFKWAQRSQGRDGFDFSKYHPKKRETVMAQLYLMNDMAGMKPSLIPMELIGSPNPVALVVHDFRQHVYSLLNCDICMKDDNLLWGETPFDHPYSSTHLDDVNDGDVYRQAHKELVTTENLHVPMGIVMFIDKTHTDLHGNLSLEPVMFTFAFFKRDLRYKHEAWRNLGYILNQSLLKYKRPVDKLADYHAMMKVVLESLVNVMESEGIAWCLKYNGMWHNVIFKPYIQFIIGDTLGHNTICGHYQGGSNAGVGSICRMCNIAPANMDDVWATFSYTKMKTIQDAVAKGKEDFLHKNSYHNVENAFHNLRFVEGSTRPAERQRKLHACVMGELLHMTQLGWHKYLLNAFFGLKKKKKKRGKNKKKAKSKSKATGEGKHTSNKKRRAIEEDVDTEEEENEDQSDEEAPVYDSEENICSDPNKEAGDEFELQEDELIYDADIDVQEKSRNKVLPASEVVLFEKIAYAVGQRLRHQSDRDLPRTNFGQGISHGTKMAGHEVQGALLLCAVVLVSTFGKSYFSPETKMGSERCQAWTGLFQLLMCLEELGKTSDPILRKDLTKLDETIKLVMDRFKHTVARDTGRALKTQKFHMCVHMMMDLYNHGLFKNSFGGMCESHLKEPKKRSRNTQRRAVNFEKQIALRTVEAIAIRAAYRKMVRSGHISQQPKGASNHKCMQGDRYAFTFKTGTITREGKKDVWVDKGLQKRVVDFLKPLLESCAIGVLEGDDKLQLYTEFKPSLDQTREDNAEEKLIYRASPAYPIKPWRDWAYVNFGKKDGIIPCHLVIFVYVDRVKKNGVSVNGVRVEEPGMYCICESLPEELQDSHEYTCNMRTRQNAPGASGQARRRLTDEEAKNQQSEESRIFYCGKKCREDRATWPTLFLVSVDSFVAPCIAIPDIPEDDHKMGEEAIYCNGDGTVLEDPLGSYIFVRPRKKWAEIFMKEQDFSAVEAG